MYGLLGGFGGLGFRPQLSISIYLYVCMYKCLHMHTFICIYIYICLYMHFCMVFRTFAGLGPGQPCGVVLGSFWGPVFGKGPEGLGFRA